MSVFPLEKVAFIGLGLIGSSLARVLREKALAKNIVATSRNKDTWATALEIGLIDAGFTDAREAVKGADLIVLAMPVAATEAVLRNIKDIIKPDAVITDVGSTKGNVVQAARNVFGDDLGGFIPGHPIAGSEKSGVMAGRSDLFVRHKVILTPLTENRPEAVALVEAVWMACGADVLFMDVQKHDEVLAKTSHLPHLLAFSLVDTLAREPGNLDVFRYAAGGFRDFTRIAASDPRMWHDIFLGNREALLSALDSFEAGVARLRAAINAQDSDELLGVFTRARAAREHFNNMLAGTAYAAKFQTKNQSFQVKAGGALTGTLRVPGDKSISHRAIMLGSLAEGVTEVSGFLEGEDSLATVQAFRDMGVVIEGPHEGRVKIHGVGLHGLQPPPGPIYCGNSGTSMRLLAGVLAAQPFESVLTGDSSLSKRPMERVASPLRQMGAVIQTTGEKGTAPLSIHGQKSLNGIHYEMPVASAQVKSSLLMAGLWAQGETQVVSPAVTRDHTERLLAGFSYPVTQTENTVSVVGGGKLQASSIDVPSDISSAAFFMVGASIAESSDITLEHVGINPTRDGVISILRLMGADIDVQNSREVGGEPVAEIRVRSSKLHGIEIPIELVPLAIDEFPAIFIAAACAEGTTTLTRAGELRMKESDRIQVMADGLTVLGIKTTVTDDGIVIEGGQIGSGCVQAHSDHRIAMAFAMAALRAKGPIEIANTANVATSFPSFVTLANKAGLAVTSIEAD